MVSAAWFEKSADEAFRKTVNGFKTDSLSVKDDFLIWDSSRHLERRSEWQIGQPAFSTAAKAGINFNKARRRILLYVDSDWRKNIE